MRERIPAVLEFTGLGLFAWGLVEAIGPALAAVCLGPVLVVIAAEMERRRTL